MQGDTLQKLREALASAQTRLVREHDAGAVLADLIDAFAAGGRDCSGRIVLAGRDKDVEIEQRGPSSTRSQRTTLIHEKRKGAGPRRVQHAKMVGASASMEQLREFIEHVARGDWTVLIEGETGTGKELVARAIHDASPRKAGPFIAVNCAGLTESLLGSQLFGHVRGAFTGASSDRAGLFEAAAGGTVFLDEVGDISASVQTALLRVLQEKEVTRIGETRPRKVDVRILAATNADLTILVARGSFREDLLYRIRVARVRVPPLRARRDDIPLLVHAFLRAHGEAATVAPEAMQRLVEHAWPGNVRELRSAVEHGLIHCRGGVVHEADLPPELARDPEALLLDALRRADGNRSRAAKLLGIGRATLYRRLRQSEPRA